MWIHEMRKNNGRNKIRWRGFIVSHAISLLYLIYALNKKNQHFIANIFVKNNCATNQK